MTCPVEIGGVTRGTGWLDDPQEVRAAVAAIAATQAAPVLFAATEAGIEGDGDEDALLWLAEVKVLGALQPSWDQGGVGTCFPPGTRVRMADGTQRKIEEVRLNDAVLTAEGNTGRVRHLFVRHEGECLIRVRICGRGVLSATAEHPVLTRRGYVRMDRLRIGDMIAVPRYMPQTTRYVQTAAHRSWNTCVKNDRAAGRAKVFNGAAQFGRKTAVVQIAPVPDAIGLTPGFGRILGLFLAEGSTDRNKVVWTFSRQEKDTLAAELVGLLKSELRAEAHIQERGKASTCRVNLHGRAWSELFASLCGNGSGLKRLHADVASGPADFLRAVYEGWLAGDGHREPGHVQGTTVSRDLALSMFDIANALGLRPCLRWCDPKPSHGVKQRLRRYDVVVATGTGKDVHGHGRGKADQDEKHLWRKVTGIVAEPYQGDVFNMEVEGDNSYVADGVGVHNCVSFGWGRGANDLVLQMAAAGEIEWPGAHVATEPIYGGSRVEVGGGRVSGDGSIGAWAAKWVRDWGVLLRQVYGGHDLTRYSESLSRRWGDRGVPDELEPLAREHPVRSVALVRTADEAWRALGSGYPIPVCSGRGFTTTLEEGFCRPSGSWAHCMELRGRVIAKRGGRLVKGYPCQNSWGGYLKGERAFVNRKGERVELPEGCFLIDEDTVHAMLRQDDSFAMSNLEGFPKRKLDWLI